MSKPRAKLTANFPGCPVESTLSFLDGKWEGVILHHLLTDGTLRFSELRRRIPAVTQRMLTKQLRELEEAGLVSRKVFAVVPPRVDYGLTPLGASLEPVVTALRLWGSEHVICRNGKKHVVMPELGSADDDGAEAEAA